MRKSYFAKAGVAAVVMMGAGLAAAQTNGPSGFSARLGLFLPSDRFARDIGDTWFAGGLDYKLNTMSVPSPNNLNPAYVGLSADFYSRGGASNLPLAVTYNVRSGQLVWSAGLGVDFYNIDNPSESGTSLGGQVGVGYEFAQAGTMPVNPIFVQAKYFFTRDSRLNGFGLYVGVRF